LSTRVTVVTVRALVKYDLTLVQVVAACKRLLRVKLRCQLPSLNGYIIAIALSELLLPQAAGGEHVLLGSVQLAVSTTKVSCSKQSSMQDLLIRSNSAPLPSEHSGHARPWACLSDSYLIDYCHKETNRCRSCNTKIQGLR
jgi:hypothetical protein